MLFRSVKLDPAVMAFAGQIFLFSSILHAGMFFISKWIFGKYEGDTQKVLRFTATFSNCAFMGYPVLYSIYGKAGIFYASIFVVPFIIALWTAGVLIFKGDHDVKNSWMKVLVNPGILAVALGILMFFSGWRFSGPLVRAFDLLGSTTTPIAMILIGSTLAEVRFKSLLSGSSVYYAAFIRLIAIPLAVLGLLMLCGVRGTVLGVCVISAGMPAAANTAAFAESFGSDAVFASRCVFVSTLLSIFTVPAIISFVQYFTLR